MSGLSRAQFLRGDWRNRAAPLRPPWALDEADFIARCTRCDACVERCPEHILKAGRGGFPETDFAAGACTFCGACAEACEPKALVRGAPGRAFPVAAAVGEACLALGNVVCRSCSERCDAGAIRFRPALGGVSKPELDRAACIACGNCVSACPTGAISMTPLSPS